MRHFVEVLGLCLLVLTFAVSTSAQVASTSEGAIVGTITDTSGAAIPNVQVTLSGAEVMGSKTVIADANG